MPETGFWSAAADKGYDLNKAFWRQNYTKEADYLVCPYPATDDSPDLHHTLISGGWSSVPDAMKNLSHTLLPGEDDTNPWYREITRTLDKHTLQIFGYTDRYGNVKLCSVQVIDSATSGISCAC